MQASTCYFSEIYISMRLIRGYPTSAYHGNKRLTPKIIVMGGKLSYPQVELKDKVAIVTGGNTGIGYETAKALAIMGAHTIIACRSEERGQQVSPSLYSITEPRCIRLIRTSIRTLHHAYIYGQPESRVARPLFATAGRYLSLAI